MTIPTPEQIETEPPGEQLAKWLCEASGLEFIDHVFTGVNHIFRVADPEDIEDIQAVYEMRPFRSIDDAWWFAERVADRIDTELTCVRFRHSKQTAFRFGQCESGLHDNPALALCYACIMAWAESERRANDE